MLTWRRAENGGAKLSQAHSRAASEISGVLVPACRCRRCPQQHESKSRGFQLQIKASSIPF